MVIHLQNPISGDPFQGVFHTRLKTVKNIKLKSVSANLNNWQQTLNLNFGKEVAVKYDALIKKLKGIDVVIFVGGISTQLEGEEMPVYLPGFKGGDRTDIELPAVQRNCLKALKQAGKKVIFVNCSGSAIALVPETESCDAILQAWYGRRIRRSGCCRCAFWRL